MPSRSLSTVTSTKPVYFFIYICLKKKDIFTIGKRTRRGTLRYYVIDLAFKSVNLLVLLSKAKRKGFSEVSYRLRRKACQTFHLLWEIHRTTEKNNPLENKPAR